MAKPKITATTKIWCCGNYYEGDDSTKCLICGFTPPSEEECQALLKEQQEAADDEFYFSTDDAEE